MISGYALAFLLAAHPGPLDGTRAELDAIAVRIEHLKQRQLGGENVRRELERLLVRAQELASRIEASLQLDQPLPNAPVPTADDLRERADVARDEADRLAAAMRLTEVRIAAIRREARLAHIGIAVADAPTAPMDRERLLRQLLAQRVELSRRMHLAIAEAARLDAEAAAIETDRGAPGAVRKTVP
jgi:hypothetical protein